MKRDKSVLRKTKVHTINLKRLLNTAPKRRALAERAANKLPSPGSLNSF